MNKLIGALLCIAFVACQSKHMQSSTSDKKANHLIDETSPYLLQHAYNPVDWHPWSEEALEKAKKENKLLLISIGYAACHWCHVMEHESFEDSTVAAIMNQYFVNIKVDREERPDIDDIYMTACQMASGRGCGWPLNCFALPDGRPVWAGTYFPKDEWKRVLEYFNNIKENEPDKLEESAKQITAGIQTMDKLEPVEREASFSISQLDEIASTFTQTMDLKKGGRSGAPKFPMPTGLSFLLTSNYHTTNRLAESAAMITLRSMANGGIYDQLGGGFARYSVDEDWLVPHFEKMLYDNGQLISVYSEAYKINQDPLFKDVVYQSIDFLQKELMSDEFGFYSSLDADSEGEEGKFYVWTSEEIDAAIGEVAHADLYKDYYNIRPKGNWEEDKNILHIKDSLAAVAQRHQFTPEEAGDIVGTTNKKLSLIRSERVRPGLDDKILCAWNGLALKGLVDAYMAFGEKAHLELALNNADFIKTSFLKDGYRLDRNYKEGHSKINGFLDDYAFVIEAFIGLYEVTFDETWLDLAKALTEHSIEHFFDETSGFFFYTSKKDKALIARKKEIGDNVIPGSNSAMARNLNLLGHYFYEENYIEMARHMLKTVLPNIQDSGQPNFYSNWCRLLGEMATPIYEIAIVGNESKSRAAEMQRSFVPNAIYLGGTDEGNLELLKGKLMEDRTMIYVCQNKVCKLPVEDSKQALTLIK